MITPLEIFVNDYYNNQNLIEMQIIMTFETNKFLSPNTMPFNGHYSLHF